MMNMRMGMNKRQRRILIEDEWENKEEQKSDDEQRSKDEYESGDCLAWVYNPTKVFKALLRSLVPLVHEENNEASNNKFAENMYVVEMLPKLEALILEDNAVVGRKWKPKDGGFHGLKKL
nr:uncharacterized protein LOC109176694 isoform X3 [Ipomoea trifida]